MSEAVTFHEIKAAAATVAESATWVTVDMDRVLMYPEMLNVGDALSTSHSAEEHLLGAGEDTLRFFLLLDAVNFGSGYFPYLNKEEGLSGYFTVASRLKQYVQANGIPDPRELLSMSREKCAGIFQQPLDNPHANELMSLFAWAWRDLAHWAISEFDGDYLGFLRTARSAQQAVAMVSSMQAFRDVTWYYNLRVPFLKRAQILLHDMDVAEPRHDLLAFSDIDDLSAFADNVLPYVFISDGLMTCHPWLEGRIEREELLGYGSIEEIELRACSLHICEVVAQVISEEYSPIPVRRLDFLIWNRGQQLKRSSSRKRHRARSVFY